MNLQSPTSLLSSIQQMKIKLRSDKQTLIDIKHDFTKFSKKTNPYSVPCKQQKDKNIEIEQSRNDKDNNCEQAQAQIRQIRREYQQQIREIMEKHEQQLNEILRIKEMEKEDVQNKWRGELEIQKKYISILQSRVSPVDLEKRETMAHKQYDTIINKLLKENTQLHQKCEKLVQQSTQWKQLYEEMETQKSSKSRFKFSKVRKDDSIMKAYQTERQNLSDQINIKKVYTYGSGYGKENMNISNISSGNKWDKIQLNLDQKIIQNTSEIQRNVLEEKNDTKLVKKMSELKI